MTATRTDAHSPLNMDPEAYEYLFAADTQSPWALGLNSTPEGHDFLCTLNNYDPATASRGTSQCHHCGAHLRYVAWLRHLTTGYTIVVGETCLDNRFSLESKADFDRLRKAAELDRAKQRIKTAVAEFIASKAGDPQAPQMTPGTIPPAHVSEWEAETFADILRKFHRYGDMSPKQYALLAKIWNKPVPQPVATPTSPAPEGRTEIIGDVVYTKTVETMYGTSVKCLVVLDSGAKVWGTLPKGCKKGERISFTATCERKAGDEFFAFYTRPAKPMVLGLATSPGQTTSSLD